MARSRPSLHPLALLSLLSLLQTATADEDFRRLGQLGKNYNINKGSPYLTCQAWTTNGTVEKERRCPVNVMVDNSGGGTTVCQGVFRVKNNRMSGDFEADLLPHEYEPVVGGCWNVPMDQYSFQCVSKDECIAVVDHSSAKRGLAFCCCTAHLCNTRVTVRFARNASLYDVDENGSLLPNGTKQPSARNYLLSVLNKWNWVPPFIIVIVLLFIAVVSFVIWKYWHVFFHRLLNSDQFEKPDEIPLMPKYDEERKDNLKEGLTYAELLARSKTSVVHLAQYKNPKTGEERVVAIKTVDERNPFLVEESVYKLCNNQHPHLVHFIGSCYEPKNSVYYLVLAHHEAGSLENHLKNETFTPLEALIFLSSFMDGLAFLHEPKHLPNGHKASIVHRDLKSRNVLVKADRTAAITDFGLGVILDRPLPERNYQCGTYRYMSPELLDGRANLNGQGLMKIDVYAASLIIWEVLNRTIVDEEDEVQAAEIPYSRELEEEAAADEAAHLVDPCRGPNEVYHEKPCIVHMRNIVHRDNKRPVMRSKLRDNEITSLLHNTAMDMWDREVDGRISSQCAHHRLKRLLGEYVKEEEEDLEDDGVKNEDTEESEHDSSYESAGVIDESAVIEEVVDETAEPA